MTSTRGRIVPCRLPWCVSPSGSFLTLSHAEETSPTRATAAVLRITAGATTPAFVELAFDDAIGGAFHGYGESGRFEPERWFDAGELQTLWREIFGGRESLVERACRLGAFEDSSVYEIRESIWDGAPLEAPWRHFVLQGSETWIEVITRGCAWVYVDAAGSPTGETGGAL